MDKDNSSLTSCTKPSWSAAPVNLSLADDEVHVWRASIDISPGQRDGFAQTLSQDEQARAERFLFQKDRDRFIASHGLLRLILGSYMMTGPEELVFCYDQRGKPSLPIDGNALRLSFNMAHSHDLALIAVSIDQEIGIDLEFIRADFPSAEIVTQFCSSEESLRYDALPKHERQRLFFIWWVRSEACLKAAGRGLSSGLNEHFRIPLVSPDGIPKIGTVADRSTNQGYSLIDLNVGFGYVAALAVQGDSRQFIFRQWHHP